MRYQDSTRTAGTSRPRYRPPLGLPVERSGGWGAAIALGLHALLVLVLVSPLASPSVDAELTGGAGGLGAAGGGGGGTRGRGRQEAPSERLQYVELAPRPRTLAAPAVPLPATPAQPTRPKVTPPEVPPARVEPPTVVSPEIDVDAPAPAPQVDLALASGVGGRTGNDGTRGSGPGAGGGVGSGVGRGRGSAAGPGRGGGADVIHPPTPDFTPIPPWPVPAKLKGQSVVLLFTVDQTGRTVKLEFQPTRDGSYNKKIRETYAEARFRPAVRGDGTPVVAVAKIELTL